MLKSWLQAQCELMKTFNSIYISAAVSDDTLFRVRRRLLKWILIALVSLGLPAVVIACIEAFKLGQPGNAILYVTIYLAILATALFFSRLPFAFCVGVLLTSLYMVSISNLINFSFAGAGIEIAITISVLATVLLGIGPGLITAETCLFTLIIIGSCFVGGVIDFTADMPATSTKAVSWVTVAAVFSFLAGSLVVVSGLLQGYLVHSLESVRQKTDELKTSNDYLTKEIKQRQETEEKLRQSQEQFKTLFEIAPDAIYLTDMEGAILDGNRKTESLLGSPLKGFIGKNFASTDFLPKAEVPKACALLKKSSMGERTGPSEFTIITASLNTTTVEVSTTPFQIDNRPVILGIARDTSERKRLESRLTQAQKMESVGRLAGGVAHDFNNMLSVILGNTELALIEANPKQSFYGNLQEIQKATQRSADVVRQLLAFARKQTIAPKVLDLNEAVAEMLKMLHRLIGEDIQISWQPTHAIWPIKIDPAQIDQILVNLSVNARDAIAGVGQLTIETGNMAFDEACCEFHPGAVPGDFVMLAVSDNGCGMDQQTRENLFEPFFTTKAVGAGTGLGLATVYGIVKQNNGFINVYSEPDQGTSFKIYFPRHTASCHQVWQKNQTDQISRGNETILLVEDEPSILKMTSQMLERLGYTVIAANTPETAIRMAGKRNGEIQLLMTDVVMPEMNGLDLTEKLLLICPDLKHLFMSGYTANVIAHHGVLDEGVNFIQKPFSNKTLAIKVREALNDPAA